MTAKLSTATQQSSLVLPNFLLHKLKTPVIYSVQLHTFELQPVEGGGTLEASFSPNGQFIVSGKPSSPTSFVGRKSC